MIVELVSWGVLTGALEIVAAVRPSARTDRPLAHRHPSAKLIVAKT